MTSRDERRLMSAFGRGELTAADELYLRFASKVYGLGLKALGDADLAEDLVQDTFIRLWRRGSQYLASNVPLEDWILTQAFGLTRRLLVRRTADRAPSRGGGRHDAEPVGV
jgi:RNA polymerase sigma-70 factor, ECF subfamily